MNSRRALRSVLLLLGACMAPQAWAQPAPSTINFAPVVTGLSGPVGIVNAGDGSGRLFVIQQGGAIRVVRDGALQTAAYFSLTAAQQCRASVGAPLERVGFTSGGERGLLGIAFHPDFESNGQLFLSISDFRNAATPGNQIGDTAILRFTIAPGNRALDVIPAGDLDSCVVMLRADQDFGNHNGGMITFGPDGFLYVFLGDGGSGNDPCDRGQTLDPATLQGASTGGSGDDCAADSVFVNSGGNPNSRALQGKILRINVNATTSAGANGLCAANADGSANYAIPASNPFLGVNAACDEVFIYGTRNPWRSSFDRLTGDLLVGDVGQDTWEEISLLPPASQSGANLDWKICEGRNLRGNCTTLCPGNAASEVIISYSTRNACGTGDFGGSVTGGFRYRGPDAALQGVYFYGDATRSRLLYSALVAGNWTAPSLSFALPEAGQLAGTVLSFGEQENGELYMVAGGTMYRIGAAAPPVVLFANGFEP